MRMSLWRTSVVSILSVALVNMSMIGAASAAIVDTSMLVTPSRDADLGAIRAQLDRADVREQMQKMGVDTSAIDTRLASLSDQELRQLATDMKSAPAGGDVLALVGAVFVVLLILELVGVIDIFKTVPR
jgi:Skp family chaperone for outer membrane proteins